ncbi:hypothetical protein [Lentzea atacamensis]|uniref:hypothetical protein n=1 Tax=Lentzea atacamensis TaxID=531938 RepID=UPI0011B4A967|nr:hypothetical protein [Lentzea atacamensis]
MMLLLLILMAGFNGLSAAGRTGNTVLGSLSPPWLLMFYAGLLVGAGMAIVGVVLPGLKGPVVEAFGLGVFTLPLLGYGAAVFVATGWRGLLTAGSFAVVMSIANVWRMFQVRREFRAARAGAVATHTTRHVEGS